MITLKPNPMQLVQLKKATNQLQKQQQMKMWRPLTWMPLQRRPFVSKNMLKMRPREKLHRLYIQIQGLWRNDASDAIDPIPFNGKCGIMMKQLDVANQSSLLLLSPLEPFITYALTVIIKMPIGIGYTPGELPTFLQVVNLDFMNHEYTDCKRIHWYNELQSCFQGFLNNSTPCTSRAILFHLGFRLLIMLLLWILWDSHQISCNFYVVLVLLNI